MCLVVIPFLYKLIKELVASAIHTSSPSILLFVVDYLSSGIAL